MLDWALDQTSHPVAVRTPAGDVVSDPACEILADYSAPRWLVRHQGARVALIGVGAMYPVVEKAAELLRRRGIDATLISPCCVTALDTETLASLADYETLVTVEDGILDGGFGQKVAAYLGSAPVSVRCLGLEKEFLNGFDPAAIASRAGLTPEGIAAAI